MPQICRKIWQCTIGINMLNLDIYSNYAEQETNIKWNPAENKRPCRNGLLLHGYFCN